MKQNKHARKQRRRKEGRRNRGWYSIPSGKKQNNYRLVAMWMDARDEDNKRQWGVGKGA